MCVADINIEWTDEKIFKLCAFYEENSCLYDVKTADYHNRLKKKHTVEKIAKEMNIIGNMKYRSVRG
jgi:Alcohol dehydrogenase transcription factor Myb/SANT-like